MAVKTKKKATDVKRGMFGRGRKVKASAILLALVMWPSLAFAQPDGVEGLPWDVEMTVGSFVQDERIFRGFQAGLEIGSVYDGRDPNGYFRHGENTVYWLYHVVSMEPTPESGETWDNHALLVNLASATWSDGEWGETVYPTAPAGAWIEIEGERYYFDEAEKGNNDFAWWDFPRPDPAWTDGHVVSFRIGVDGDEPTPTPAVPLVGSALLGLMLVGLRMVRS